MRSLLLTATIALALSLSACGKKKTVETAADGAGGGTDSDAPVFVDLSLDEEDDLEDDMMGSELVNFDAECGNLRKLEPKAMMGKLSDAEIRCLDGTLREGDKQTYRDKISRVLMADAFAKQNDDRWETIVRRHLNDIDRSDPDLCYKFATFMLKRVPRKGPDAADEVMKWSDVALENKQQWTGDTYVKRVSMLYRVKATAAFKKWEFLENKFNESPSDELSKGKEEARNEAKNLAREWLAYSKDAGLDMSKADAMCQSAAGTSEFCEI
ncbi:MAG: hypothetical protein AB8H79_08585 [Myxococcota bacterium]